jgi:pimeloyl-ACP methyl ester carboxylesterase
VNALFLLGGQSEYISPSDLILIQKYFPHAKIVEISEGGHYIQFTHNEEFMKKLIAFLTS